MKSEERTVAPLTGFKVRIRLLATVWTAIRMQLLEVPIIGP